MDGSVWLAAFVTSMLLFQFTSVPALILRKNDLADVLWGPAFPISAAIGVWWSGTTVEQLGAKKCLVLALLVVWAARLFAHVGWRNLSHIKEDVRYNNWRKEWGSTWVWRSYLQVFVLQPLILYLFLLPVLFILSKPNLSFGVLGIAGILIWCVGFFFEAVSDEQLRRFKKDPRNKGRLITSGLWSWTRHPNYFGEVTMWWGIWLIAMDDVSAWWTVLGPIGVTYLILKVSGVSMLEELMKSRPGYEEYVSSVPAFFPRPPKKPSL